MTSPVAVSSSSIDEPKEKRQGLFRKQVVEKQQDRLLGDVLVVPPLSYSIITSCLILLFIAVVVLLSNGSYARKETVQGFLVPDAGTLKVYSPRTGIVRSVFVKEGESVAVDQPLMLISGDQILANGDHLESLMLDEYLAQKKMLSNQLDRIPEVYESKFKEIDSRIDAIKIEHKHLKKQEQITNQQLNLALNHFKSIEQLSRNSLATKNDSDIAYEKVLALRSQLLELSRTKDAQINSLNNLGIQRVALGFEKMDKEDQLESSLSVISQHISQLHGQRAIILRASSAGIVSNIQINEGQEALNNIPLLTISPNDSSLEAELLVPARAIGFVEKGQPVKIRYSAFSFQKFGLYDAEITNVSQTVLMPNELTGISVNVQEPMYRVTAALSQQFIEAYGKPLSLKEGISLEADIKLAERSLLEWAFEPLLSLKGRL